MPSQLRKVAAALGAAAILAVSAMPVQADLVGVPAEPPALSESEQTTLAQNPDLAALAAVNPWALRLVLNALASPPAPTRSKDVLRLDPADVALLNANPALAQFSSASPEAAAELLALIRSAGRPRAEPAGK